MANRRFTFTSKVEAIHNLVIQSAPGIVKDCALARIGDVVVARTKRGTLYLLEGINIRHRGGCRIAPTGGYWHSVFLCCERLGAIPEGSADRHRDEARNAAAARERKRLAVETMDNLKDLGIRPPARLKLEAIKALPHQ